MLKTMKRLLSFSLALILLLALLPGGVLAEEEDEFIPDPDAEAVVLETEKKYNPAYADVFTPEQIDALKKPDTNRSIFGSDGIRYATTFTEAGAQLRAGMKAYRTSFSVYAAIQADTFSELSDDDIRSIVNQFWTEAIKVTTDGREGDYLDHTWLSYERSISCVPNDDGDYILMTVDYSFVYITDADKERTMTAYADQVIGYFGFTRQTSAYDKIRTIYDYVTANISYTADENIDTPLYHTAYSAIVMKDTVCQGYALLLYYMLWRCEIPCRYVRGGGHAWNIVWLRGQWYSLDATWDRGTGGAYTFFLRGRDTGFYNTHEPEGDPSVSLVNHSCPTDYGTKRSADYGSCTEHADATSTYTTDDGCTCYWCSACGQSATGSFGTYRYVDWGYCGDNLFWKLDSDGCLWIDGSGDMWDNKIIWFPHRNCVLSAALSDDITSIGALAFENTDYLSGLWLPKNLVRIGESAFWGCNSLSWIVVPEAIGQIDQNAFAYCSSLADVYFEGTSAQWDSIRIADGNEYLTDARRHYYCTVSFNANGGSGEMSAQTWFSELKLILKSNAFTRDGYVFTGWNTKADGTGVSYADGATFTLTGDVTLYAQWAANISITTQPKSVTMAAGGNASFTVAATGPNLTYQWQVCNPGSSTWKNSPAAGNKTATLTVPATADRSGNKYRCIVSSGSTSVTSNAATLLITGVVKITTQPANATVVEGNNAAFKVVASGTNLTYQWQVSTNGGSSWSNSPADGNKTATLTIPATMSRNGYKYRCVE